VPVDQVVCPWQQDGYDLFLNVLRPPVVQGVRVMYCQWSQLEIQEFVYIQFANLVEIVETPVLTFVIRSVHDALFDQETAPQVVAVTRNQGVVEIEKCNAHGGFYSGLSSRQGYTNQNPWRVAGSVPHLLPQHGYGRIVEYEISCAVFVSD